MSFTQELSSILLLELLAVLSLIPMVWGVLTFLRKRRDRAGVRALIAAVREGKEENARLTRSWLEQEMGLEGAAVTQSMKELGVARTTLFQSIINLYLTRDAGSLAALAGELDALTGGYQALRPVAPEAKMAAAADEPASAAAPEPEAATDLQRENERLSGELRISKETIGGMLDEYAEMFSGSDDDKRKEAPEKAAAGTALEGEEDGEVEL